MIGAAFGPPLAAVAAEKIETVIVGNTAENPVPTKPVGTTDVRGIVAVETPITIHGTAADRPLPVTPVGTTQVNGVVGLADGARVALADGTTVGLADGTSVLVSSPVQLADDTSVRINNADADAVPVRVVSGGGGGGDRVVKTPLSFRSTIVFQPGDPNASGPHFTVPAGKVFVITAASGFLGDTIDRVLLEHRRCGDSGAEVFFQHGVITGERPGGRMWTLHGESRAPAGCELVPFFTRVDDPGTFDTGNANIFGYLIDE